MGKGNHINGLHILDMRLVYDNLNGKVKDRSYEADGEYEVLEVEKCCSLTRIHLDNHMICTCEWNYKDERHQHWKGNFIDLMFERPIPYNEKYNLMTKHDGIDN